MGPVAGIQARAQAGAGGEVDGLALGAGVDVGHADHEALVELAHGLHQVVPGLDQAPRLHLGMQQVMDPPQLVHLGVALDPPLRCLLADPFLADHVGDQHRVVGGQGAARLADQVRFG